MTDKLQLMLINALLDQLLNVKVSQGSEATRLRCDRIFNDHYLRAVGRKVLWSAACVCLCVCVCALLLSARYLKNGFMDHHQIWWVGAGGEPLEQVQFWC